MNSETTKAFLARLGHPPGFSVHFVDRAKLALERSRSSLNSRDAIESAMIWAMEQQRERTEMIAQGFDVQPVQEPGWGGAVELGATDYDARATALTAAASLFAFQGWVQPDATPIVAEMVTKLATEFEKWLTRKPEAKDS